MKSTKEMLLFIILLAVVYVAALQGVIPELYFGDPGLGWHLKNGELILAGEGIVNKDPFTQLGGGRRWVYSQWLADFTFALVHSTFGFRGLHAFCVALSLFPLAAVLKRSRVNQWGLILSFTLCLGGLSLQWLCRPVLFSFALFGLTLAIARIYSQSYSQSYRQSDSLELERGRAAQIVCYLGFFTLFALWANLHPAFALGLIALFLYILVAIVKRQWLVCKRFALITLLAFIGTLCSPSGLDAYFAIYGLTTSTYFQSLNREWLSPQLTNTAFWPFFVLLPLAVLSGLWRLRSSERLEREREFVPDATEFLLLLLLGVMSVSARRYIPFFAILAFRPVAEFVSFLPLSKRAFSKPLPTLMPSSRSFLPILIFVLLGLPTLGVLAPFPRITYEQAFGLYPVALLQGFTEQQRQTESLPARVYHPAEFGGIVTYIGYPSTKALIDDRNQLFSEAEYKQVDGFFQRQSGWYESGIPQAYTHILCRKSAPIVSELLSSDWIIEQESSTMGGAVVLLKRR